MPPANGASLLAAIAIAVAGSIVPGTESIAAEGRSGGGANEPAEPAAARRSGDCARSGCHEELVRRKFVHGPVSQGKCEACHRAVAGEEHRFEPAREESKLCTFCHDGEEKRTFVHKPYAAGTCTACHDPHGGTTRPFLVEESTAKLCEACHENKEPAFAHSPVKAGKCLSCHLPHQSERKSLLAADGAEVCRGCHEDVGKLEGEGHVHPPAKEGCLACHQGHGGANDHLLKRPPGALCVRCHETIAKRLAPGNVVHGPVKKESCPACHDPHASPSKDLLVKPTATELCLSCHSEEIATSGGKKLEDIGKLLETSKWRHGPLVKGDCASCHDPHGSPNARLLVSKYPASFYAPFGRDEYALCFTCHAKARIVAERTRATGFRDGDRNLHYVHVNRPKGRTCSVCHEMHAGTLPGHMRETAPFGSGGWRLPIGFEATPSGGRCASGCHPAKVYDRGPEPADEATPPERGEAPAGAAAKPAPAKSAGR